MNLARYTATYNGLNAAARKVHDAVPMQEPWTVAQIVGELRRQGSSLDHRVTRGCLRVLVEAGLVIERAGEKFQRITIRIADKQQPAPQPAPQQKEPAMPENVTPLLTKKTPEPATPMDRLGALAKRVNDVAIIVKNLASELSDAAVEIQAELEAKDANNTKELAKLRQFQALLKGLAE
jgi:hypothetical protein